MQIGPSSQTQTVIKRAVVLDFDLTAFLPIPRVPGITLDWADMIDTSFLGFSASTVWQSWAKLNLLFMEFDLASLAPSLEQREPGLWFTKQNHRPVSYPEDGNAACLAIEDRSFWFRHRNRVIAEVVSRFHRRGMFFDVGGGNGYVAKALMAAGIQCVLVEPGINGAMAALARSVEPVICARLEDISLPPGCVASVGLFDVLEHIKDETAALELIHSLLEPSGHLFLSVPAYQFLFSSEDEEAGHFRRYTVSSLGRVLAQNGFQIAFCSYFFTPLPPLIFLRRTITSWFGKRRKDEQKTDCSEHTPSGSAAWAMDHLLEFEFRRLRTGKRFRFGGSCICVAVKREIVSGPPPTRKDSSKTEEHYSWRHLRKMAGRGWLEVASLTVKRFHRPSFPFCYWCLLGINGDGNWHAPCEIANSGKRAG